jgi:hypothetical protein
MLSLMILKLAPSGSILLPGSWFAVILVVFSVLTGLGAQHSVPFTSRLPGMILTLSISFVQMRFYFLDVKKIFNLY